MSAQWLRRESLPEDDPATMAVLEQQRSAALDIIRESTSFVLIARSEDGVRVCQAVRTEDIPKLLRGLVIFNAEGGRLLDPNPDGLDEAA